MEVFIIIYFIIVLLTQIVGELIFITDYYTRFDCLSKILKIPFWAQIYMYDFTKQYLNKLGTVLMQAVVFLIMGIMEVFTFCLIISILILCVIAKGFWMVILYFFGKKKSKNKQ